MIKSISRAHKACKEKWIRGPLGLYLALNAAAELAFSAKPDGKRWEQIEDMLRDRSTRKCFCHLYDIGDSYELADARLHRIGTTSLILRCTRAGEVVALKCLLPRYHRVKAIRERTKSYKSKYSIDSPVAPRIIASTELTITMEFIEGQTLAERFDARIKSRQKLKGTKAKKRALHDDDVKFVREVGLAICECLAELAAQKHEHLDLSPSNIIVVSDERDYRLRIRLIDFGQNFAITERVGSAAAYRQAALYVAPELIHDGTPKEAWRCDAYSLGVILLEAASLCELRKENLAVELERLWQGERPWEGAPQIGRIIDELLDEEMSYRLALDKGPEKDGEEKDGRGDPCHAYDYLQKLIRQETEVLELYKDQTEGSGFGLLRGVGLIKVYKNTQLVNLLNAARVSEESVDDAYDDFPVLARWAFLSMFAWALAVGSFVMMTLADLHWGTVKPWAEQIAELCGNHYKVGAIKENLPGRLVALTFALTAVTYYVNNFATLSPMRIGRRIGRLSAVLMRLTSFFFLGPILFVILCNPEGWALPAGMVTLLIVANNYVALRIGLRAFDVFHANFTPKGTAGYKFVHDVFKEWWVLMLWYSVAMIGIGVLREFGTVDSHDLWVFAALVVIANVAKLYRTNCVETAPQVRGSLSRAILTLRRANRLNAKVQDKKERVKVQSPGVSRRRRRPLAAVSRWWWEPPRSRSERRRRWQQRRPATADALEHG